jgi:hypothetical protein
MAYATHSRASRDDNFCADDTAVGGTLLPGQLVVTSVPGAVPHGGCVRLRCDPSEARLRRAVDLLDGEGLPRFVEEEFRAFLRSWLGGARPRTC